MVEAITAHVPESIRAPLSRQMRSPLVHRLGRWLLRVALVIYFVFALLILALRYWVMPEIANYRPNIEQALSTALQRPVHIRELSAHWVGLRPAAYLRGLVISDAQNQPALQLDQVDAQLGWDSFLVGSLRLAHLEIQAPELDLRRDSTGQFFVAGMAVTPGSGDDNALADWLLAQDRIVVRQAHLRWRDEQRDAPILELNQVDLKIENSGRRHRFAIKTAAIASSAEHLDIRGEFHGRDLATWRDWHGDLYIDVANADLAVWQRWVDYPIALTQGHGSAKLWLEVADQTLRKITADSQLKEVSVRLQQDLPVLALRDLSGRLSLERDRTGFELKANKLVLSTHDNQHVAPIVPITLSLRINDTSPTEQRGQGSVNALDLANLSALAKHLPLPGTIAAQLDHLGAQGQLSDVQFSWVSDHDALRRWNIGAQFSGLGLQALGPLPRIQGVSGNILGNQDSGRLSIASRNAQIELPTIFPEPRIDFAKLDAVVEWDRAAEGSNGMQINLRRASFENQDAAGSASGQWRPVNDDPLGIIDLKAEVPHADGTAVWRYLPTVVGKASRDWLRHAVTGGQASGTTLTLKGKLSEFPFRRADSGTFEVRSQIHGARLSYGDSWPIIEDIDGELVFHGPGMLITVNSGTSSGAQLHHVQAEIADLELPTTLLTVKGQASGPTSTFLRFIEASPVGESIDHFTRPMSATGNGMLDLSLQLPLDDIDKSTLQGRYRLDANTVQLDASLPPVSGVNGQIDFTENSLSSTTLRGSLLGGPVSASIKTEKEAITIGLSGEATVAGLRRYALLDGLPALNYLSGSSKWAGNIRVGSKGTEISISSNLAGLASTLPAPLTKSAAESLPVRFERKPLRTPAADKTKVSSRDTAKSRANNTNAPPGDDLLDLSVGKQIRLQLARRLNAGEPRIVRGLLAVGRSTARLPEKDLLLSLDLPALDLDFWRQNLMPPSTAGSSGSTATSTTPSAKSPLALLPLSFDLRTDSLQLMDRRFPDVRVTGRRVPDAAGDGQTRAEVRSQAFSATLDYNERGAGRLTGVIPQLLIPEIPDDLKAANSLDAPTREIIKRLPSIDLTVEKLAYKKQELGKLSISAENRAGSWDAKLALRNPDATLDGTAKWRPEVTAGQSSVQQTQVDFHADAKSLEKLLERLGFAGSMRRGSGQFDGKLTWQGAPISVDYPTLGGTFQFEASDGQFNKLEPGVGRLLGILSLQSLPRRITLDFRDIFSQGFAFDRIAGNFVVKQGVMTTDNLEVRGPAAKVQMSGQVDLGRETQDLTVHVKPAVGESIAVGAMLANPVAGAVAWAAQKLLSDPLDQAFSFDYAVSGSWSDPKVDKLGDKPKSTNSTGTTK